MSTRFTLAVLVAASALATLPGCSTVDGRIQKHQSTFQALPPDQQQKIREGQVDVGFTPEMVMMALGEPDRRYTRTSATGTTEVWAYRSKAPAISFGFGFAGGGGGSSVGAGVGVGTGDRSDDKLRVVFAEGRVSLIERAGKS